MKKAERVERAGAVHAEKCKAFQAINGDGAIFSREDAVESAWTVVEPVLESHHHVHPYARGSWGPLAADKLIERDCCWHNPTPEQASRPAEVSS